MIISIDARKAFDKTQYPLIVENTSKLGVKRNFLNLNKGSYQKGTSIPHSTGGLYQNNMARRGNKVYNY